MSFNGPAQYIDDDEDYGSDEDYDVSSRFYSLMASLVVTKIGAEGGSQRDVYNDYYPEYTERKRDTVTRPNPTVNDAVFH